MRLTLTPRRLALTGCLAAHCALSCTAGHGVFFVPNERDIAQYDCGPFTVRLDGIFADGFGVLYYLIPLAPLPSGSDTESQLEVDVVIHSPQPLFEMTTNDIGVRLPDSPTLHRATAMLRKVDSANPDKRWYYRKRRFLFDLDRSTVSQYTVIFPGGLHGCAVPDTVFHKEIRSDVASPVNR